MTSLVKYFKQLWKSIYFKKIISFPETSIVSNVDYNLVLSYFLPLHSAPGSSFVFPAPVLESDIYWRLVLENEV